MNPSSHSQTETRNIPIRIPFSSSLHGGGYGAASPHCDHPPPPPPFPELLRRCSFLPSLKKLHARFIIGSLPASQSLLHHLVRSYVAHGRLSDAQHLFDQCPPRTAVLWNILIQAYSKPPFEPDGSLCLFRRMLAAHGPGPPVSPDKYTFTFVISACSRKPSPMVGEAVHGQVARVGLLSDVFVGNSLLNLYSMFGRLEDASRLFDEMPLRDVITWTTLVTGYLRVGEIGIAEAVFKEMPERNDVSWAVMISGYIQVSRCNDAVRCFHDMLSCDGMLPNEAVLVSVLSACAQIGALNQGNWIHAHIDKGRLPQTSNITTALIDMYSKCGRIDCANQVFSAASGRDILTWTSMISGLAMHGHGRYALELFNRMVEEGVKPDDITLLGVLNACSHSGLVEEGCFIFDSMVSAWGIVPKVEHYGCLIDLLGRAGRLNKALEVVDCMPVEPDAVIWRSLLSACRTHGDVHLAELIGNRMSRYQPNKHDGEYVLLSNLYASVNCWDKVTNVRDKMWAPTGSAPGCSFIEIDGIIHEFLAADKLHPEIADVHSKLEEVLSKVSIEAGYIAHTKKVLSDLCEEEKEQAVSWHGEKLAVAFGLMSQESE